MKAGAVWREGSAPCVVQGVGHRLVREGDAPCRYLRIFLPAGEEAPNRLAGVGPDEEGVVMGPEHVDVEPAVADHTT